MQKEIRTTTVKSYVAYQQAMEITKLKKIDADSSYRSKKGCSCTEMTIDSPKTRMSLILKLKSDQDVSAWHEFVQIYQPLIYRMAIRKGLQEADALDLIQEVLTRVAKAIETWDPDPGKGSFRAWLATITRNMIVEFFRSQKRLPDTTDRSDIQRLLSNQCTPVDDSFEREHRRQVFHWAAAKVRAGVEARVWQAFWATTIDAKPIREAAEDLEMSVGAIYIARCRLMAKIRSHVERYESDTSMLEVPS